MLIDCVLGVCSKGCCHFCDKRERCEDVCKNDPKRCGCLFTDKFEQFKEPEREAGDKQIFSRHPNYIGWTHELDTELVNLYHSGLTVRQVAAKIRRGRTATQVRLHQLGVQIRGTGGRKEIPADDQVNLKIKALYLDGKNMTEIAAIIGLDHDTVSYRLDKMGVEKREQKKWTDVYTQKLIELCEQGAKQSELAKILGFAERTIAIHKKALGAKRKVVQDDKKQRV